MNVKARPCLQPSNFSQLQNSPGRSVSALSVASRSAWKDQGTTAVRLWGPAMKMDH